MKGNETRVVIFLQPVNPPREGQVSTLQESKWKFSPFSLFLVLGALLGLGMLAFVLLTIKSDANSGPESTTVSTNPTIPTITTTTTESTTMAMSTTASTPTTTTETTTPTAATTVSSRHF